MTNERWENLIEMIEANFKIDEKRSEELDLGEDANGKPVKGEIEIIEFQGPTGKIRLERITKPLVLEKKTQYSRRIGSQTKVSYIYSETEKVYQLKAYQWKDGTWQEIETGPSPFNL
jgi:Txe/YoeB family toxin of Txe-Axe toxin-antitoxin module